MYKQWCFDFCGINLSAAKKKQQLDFESKAEVQLQIALNLQVSEYL